MITNLNIDDKVTMLDFGRQLGGQVSVLNVKRITKLYAYAYKRDGTEVKLKREYDTEADYIKHYGTWNYYPVRFSYRTKKEIIKQFRG